MQQSNRKFSPVELKPGDELIGYHFSAQHPIPETPAVPEAPAVPANIEAKFTPKILTSNQLRVLNKVHTHTQQFAVISHQVSLTCNSCGHRLRVKDEDGHYTGLYQYQKDTSCTRCNTPGMKISIRTCLSEN